MMDQNIAIIKDVFSHFVGNRSYDDRLILSQNNVNNLSDEEMKILRDHFLQPFSELDNFHQFSHEVDLSLNEIYVLVGKVFNGESDTLAISQALSKLLLKRSIHPNIKTGDFHFIYFKDLICEGEIIDGIGLFKTEEKNYFIVSDLNKEESTFNIHKGVAKNRIDKGCLIFNIDDSEGYKVLLIDKTNRGKEASFWKETFLDLKPINAGFSFTENYIAMCNAFVKEEMAGIDQPEKIDVVNKSLQYFKENQVFDKASFVEKVFVDKSFHDSFEKFGKSYSEHENVLIEDRFDISKQAVAKKSRSLKRILKLDDNFQIHINGGKNLIEKGYDKATGKSFYKFYFDEEK